MSKITALNEDIYLSNRKNKLSENIIEESGDGYIKFGDGTMICYGSTGIQTTAVTTTWGNGLYCSNQLPVIRFPQEFISQPYYTASVHSEQGNSFLMITDAYSTSTTTTSQFQILRGTSSNSVTYSIHYTAIGRWK